MVKQVARVNLTAARIEALECPPDKSQSFVWDTQAPTLLLRVSNRGRKTYAFESRLDGRTIRLTIGDVKTWPLAKARTEANRLKALIDQGTDPREVKRQQQETRELRRQQQEAEAVSFGEVWQAYTADRWDKWGDHHRKDHQRLTRAPGKTKAGKATIAGPLYCFWNDRLADMTPERIETWADEHGKDRPTVARLSWRLLRAFFAWCAEQPEYQAIVTSNPAKTKDAREALGSSKARTDSLLKTQLAAWFKTVQGVGNPTAAAYIQTMLLTGARPNELLALRWDDINTRWNSITLRDKDESKGGKDGTRDIPLTPYVRHLLASLPHRNEWVFSSAGRTKEDEPLDAPISTPHKLLRDANRVAGIGHVTFQGLRRSFGSLSEWLEIPAGVVAQIQGHKPSATAEKHYRVRPLDLLALHHNRFEAWILEQAGITFDPEQAGGLRIVAGKEAQR